MPRKLEVQIVGDASSLERAMKSAGRSTGVLGGRFGKLGKLAGIGGLAAGVGVAVGALKKSVDAAKEAELAQRRMETQLSASNISYDKHKGQIDRTIAAHSRLSAFDDEELQDSFTSLVRTTGDVNEALKLNALAADLARGKNMSLEAASKVIGKVAAGNTGALGRLGITLEKGATATEALAEVQRRFKGQAEAYGSSAAGAQDKFKVALENLMEAVGKHVLPLLTRFMVRAAEAVVWLEANWPRISEAIRETMDKIRPYVEPVYEWLKAATQLVVDLIQGDWSGALDQIVNMLKSSLQLVETIIKGWYSLIWAATKALWKGIFDAAVEGLGDIGGWMTGKLGEVLAAIGKPFQSMYDKAKELGGKVKSGAVAGVTGIGNAVWAIVDNIGARLIAGAETIIGWGKTVGVHVKNAAVAGVTGIGNAVWDVVNNIGAKIADSAGTIVGWGKDLGGWLKDGVKSALGDIASWLVKQVKDAINALIRRVNSALEFSFTVNLPDKIPGLPDQFTVNVNPRDIPQLAMGGTAFANKPHLVGERGPELFVPGRTGTVLPNGAGAVVHEHHYHGPVVQDKAFLDYLRNLERKFAGRNGTTAFGTT